MPRCDTTGHMEARHPFHCIQDFPCRVSATDSWFPVLHEKLLDPSMSGNLCIDAPFLPYIIRGTQKKGVPLFPFKMCHIAAINQDTYRIRRP